MTGYSSILHFCWTVGNHHYRIDKTLTQYTLATRFALCLAAVQRRCQDGALTHKQRATVIVIDVDRRGRPGGTIDCVDENVRDKLAVLAAGGAGPAWIGVNPTNGKCQLIWMIDPVYADSGEMLPMSVCPVW